jgi:hypothetical protein
MLFTNSFFIFAISSVSDLESYGADAGYADPTI